MIDSVTAHWKEILAGVSAVGLFLTVILHVFDLSDRLRKQDASTSPPPLSEDDRSGASRRPGGFVGPGVFASGFLSAGVAGYEAGLLDQRAHGHGDSAVLDLSDVPPVHDAVPDIPDVDHATIDLTDYLP